MPAYAGMAVGIFEGMPFALKYRVIIREGG
jgi:hypothetical protein